MPGQELLQANPPPDPSAIPDSMLQYSVLLNTQDYLSKDELGSIKAFTRAANYIAAGQSQRIYPVPANNQSSSAMIFLSNNVLLEDKLTHADIKPRLLGHWGTCPGLSLIYAHLNRLIKNTDIDALYVVGPGRPRSLYLSKSMRV
jgi:xylulose-5-phosphate/fructose-6-phosphate phosphoketolase